MSLGHETVLATYVAANPRDFEKLASQALSEMGDTLCVLASEDTMQRFLNDHPDLQNPQRAMERVRSEHKFLGVPFAFEKKAGNEFIFTSLTHCIKVRYASA